MKEFIFTVGILLCYIFQIVIGNQRVLTDMVAMRDGGKENKFIFLK
jgi:hypothetical protein